MKKNTENYPHNGNFLKKAIREKGLSSSELAQLTGHHPSLFPYYKRSASLSFKVLWNLGLSLERNLISELGESFPLAYETEREKALKKENEELKRELEIYKQVIGLTKK